jgi:hypothetical protein
MDVVWTSQVTHTGIKVVGTECRSATYTTNAGTPLVYALGTVFDAPGGQVSDPYHPKSKTELGQFTDERVARAACEAFCEGKSEEEILDVVRSLTASLALAAKASSS